MKKNWILIYLFCLGITSYGKSNNNPNTNNTYVGLANYERVMMKIADDNQNIFNYRFSRDLDVYNSLHNNKTNYIDKINKDYEDMNYVGVDLPEFYISGKSDRKSVMYFGNGNNIKDLKIKSEFDFQNIFEKTQEDKKEKFYLHKGYSSLHLKYVEDEDKRNPLSISIDEYKNNIEGKSIESKNNFIKERLSQKLAELGLNKNIVSENGKLYTEENGKKYPIFYDIKPVTVSARLGSDEFDLYDDVYNVIWINNLFPENTKIEKLLYTSDGDLIIEDLEQFNKVEIFGRGRIDGEIDFNGKIFDLSGTAKTFQGKYGRSIVLGSKTKLKNVKQIVIGKDQLGQKSLELLAGTTSLSLDIDPNIKNEQGHIIGHAFSELDPNMDITGQLGVSDKFFPTVQLMVSKIPEKSKIAIDKPLEYTAQGDSTKRRIRYISDSIAHHITEDSELTDTPAILSVELKDNIKRLSNEENKIYKSIADSKKINLLSPTISSVNKRLIFSAVEIDKEKEKKAKLEKYLTERKTEDEIIKDLSEFTLSDKGNEEVKSLIRTLYKKVDEKEENDRNNRAKLIEIENNIKNIEELEKFANEQIEIIKTYDLGTFKKSISKKQDEDKREMAHKLLKYIDDFNSNEIYKRYDDDSFPFVEEDNNTKKYLSLAKRYLTNYVNGESSQEEVYVWPRGNVLTTLTPEDQLKRAIDRIYWLTNPDEDDNVLNNLVTEKKKESYINSKENQKIEINNKLNETVELNDRRGDETSVAFRRLKEKIYYSLREEEALQEFKTMLSQLQDTNIYSKMNKVAKNELTTYTNIPFDINRNLSEKKHLARGGYISSRNVQQNFKGNTYTAYGLYEKEFLADTKLGFMVGGSSTNHTLTHNKRTAKTTPATSSSKGISAYLGAYAGKKLYQELNWISGLGFQYGKYDITRNLRNNYQTLTSKGKVDILGLNAYSGLVLDYPLQEDVVVQVKGLLSYSFINQGKVREKEGLNLDINNKNYNYLDSEIGVNFSKTLYDFGVKSNLSAGIYRVMGVYGYKNSNLSAKINGSSHSFAIKGDKVQKDAVKLFIDYNVQKDSGLNYGLDGTYITNSKETDVRFGFKAGYTF